jgi:prevent-host-death family protein
MSSSWKLQDAKARFSEVVRRAKQDGPQRVTVHGRDEAVVVSAHDFERLAKSNEDASPRSGQAIIDAFALLRGADIQRESVYSPVRDTPNFDEDRND